ncbi:MAG TPA: carotenoid biosynthesis protein [Prolixibacteraceae bacterium]|nr:carotenoid biosynthesis protein [Prolixibacteraceae bacterium]
MKRIIRYFTNLSEREATKFLIIFYIVGIIGFLIPYTRHLFEILIPITLLINIFLLFLFHKPFDPRHVIFFVSVAVITFAIEAIGVNTGVLFGDYLYGESLPVKLFHTPVIIGLNWLLLSYGITQLIRNSIQLRKYLIILGAAGMTFFDFFMEPVAMKTGMWTWAYNVIPYTNYIMWFVVSALILAGFELFKIRTDQKTAGRIFLFQFMFFLILYFFLK